jgi:hypothetical protein
MKHQIITSQIKTLVAIVSMSQIFVIFSFLFNSPAIAGFKVRPRTVINTGRLIHKFIKNRNSNSNTDYESQEAQNVINSGQPYVVYYYVQMSDGQYYKVCQNAQNAYAISEPYFCQ